MFFNRFRTNTTGLNTSIGRFAKPDCAKRSFSCFRSLANFSFWTENVILKSGCFSSLDSQHFQQNQHKTFKTLFYALCYKNYECTENQVPMFELLLSLLATLIFCLLNAYILLDGCDTFRKLTAFRIEVAHSTVCSLQRQKSLYL